MSDFSTKDFKEYLLKKLLVGLVVFVIFGLESYAASSSYVVNLWTKNETKPIVIVVLSIISIVAGLLSVKLCFIGSRFSKAGTVTILVFSMINVAMSLQIFLRYKDNIAWIYFIFSFVYTLVYCYCRLTKTSVINGGVSVVAALVSVTVFYFGNFILHYSQYALSMAICASIAAPLFTWLDRNRMLKGFKGQ